MSLGFIQNGLITINIITYYFIFLKVHLIAHQHHLLLFVFAFTKVENMDFYILLSILSQLILKQSSAKLVINIKDVRWNLKLNNIHETIYILGLNYFLRGNSYHLHRHRPYIQPLILNFAKKKKSMAMDADQKYRNCNIHDESQSGKITWIFVVSTFKKKSGFTSANHLYGFLLMWWWML